MQTTHQEVKLTIPATIMFIPERTMFESVVLDTYNKKYGYDSPLEPNTELFCSIRFKGTRKDRYSVTQLADEVLKTLEGVAFDSRTNIVGMVATVDDLYEPSIEVHIMPMDQVQNLVKI